LELPEFYLARGRNERGNIVKAFSRQFNPQKTFPTLRKIKWILFNQISLSIVDRLSGSRMSHVGGVVYEHRPGLERTSWSQVAQAIAEESVG